MSLDALVRPCVLLAFIAGGIFLPWQVWQAAPYDLQRVAQLGAVALFVLVFGFRDRHRLYRACFVHGARRWRLVGLGVAVLAVAAVLASRWPGVALLELCYLLGLGAAALLLVPSAREMPRSGWMLLGGLTVMLMAGYAMLAILHVGAVWVIADIHDVGPGFANVRFFADVAVGLMPLAPLYALARPVPSRAAAVLCLVPLTVWWWLLWVSESRGALLGLIVGALGALWLGGREARRAVGMMALSGGLGLLGWWTLNPIGGGAGDSAFARDLTGGSGRLALWHDALSYALAHFPLGIGPMGFAGDGVLRESHAHNLFLNTAAEWGLPLALLLLALLLRGLWSLARRARTLPACDRPVAACLAMALIGVMVNLQVSGAQVIPLSALVTVLVAGLAFGFRSPAAVERREPGGGASLRGTLLWAALALAVVYACLAGLALHPLSVASRQACFEAQGRVYLHPRFWVQGRLECMQEVAPGRWMLRSWR